MRSTTPTPAAAYAGYAFAGRRVASLLLGWCGVAWGIADHDGRYTPYALGLVVAGTACVTAALVGRPGESRRPEGGGRGDGPRPLPPGGRGGRWPPVALAATALLVGLAPIIWHPHYYASGPSLLLSHVLLGLAGPLAAATLLPALHGRDWPFWTALGLATAAGFAMVVAAPHPQIDVFALLQGSTRGIVRGADMYRQTWAPSRADYQTQGLFDVYPYLPGTSLLLLPFRLLLGDVRYGLVLALGVAAVLARRLADPRAVPALVPLLLAVHPKVTYADQQSWTEPMLVAALAGFVLAVTSGRHRLAVVCLAAALASKQHVALLLPVAAMWPAFGPRRAARAAGLAALVVAPWVLAGPRDFWHDAVATNLAYPALGHSLSLPGLAARYGVALGFGPAAVALAGAYLLAWRRRGDAFGFCAGGALVVLALALTNTQTFFNHYTLAMGLAVLAALVGGTQRVVEKRSSEPPSSSGRRPSRTLRSRSAASWSETTAQLPSSVR